MLLIFGDMYGDTNNLPIGLQIDKASVSLVGQLAEAVLGACLGHDWKTK